MGNKKKKGAIELEMLGWILIALAILTLFLAAYFILSGRGTSAIQHIKNLFRFGS